MRTLILGIIFGMGIAQGCGQAHITAQVDYQGFEKEFSEFKAFYGHPIWNLTISFGSTDEEKPTAGGKVVGICKSWASGAKTITINKEFWDRSSDAMHEQLIFHEMGHCVLGLEHNDQGSHIMNATLLPEAFYVQYRDWLIVDLFHGNER